MKKNLLLKSISLIALGFCFQSATSQNFAPNGDIINSVDKGSPVTIMAYTPCPVLTSTLTKLDQVNCVGVTNGSASITAGGGMPSYYYSWFGPRTYDPISLPAFSSNYSASQARGFWFTSPTTTVITGIMVPTDIGTANQFVYVVKYAATPPTFPTQDNNYTVLGKYLDVPGNDTIKCGIAINTGDIIGILGVRGSTTSATGNMSYAPGGFASSISGFPVALYRFMSQTDITTNNLGQLCEGGTGSIGRVEVFFGNAISLNQNATNLPAGNYSTFFTDTNGCMNTRTVTINPGLNIMGATSFTNPTCALGNDGQAAITVSAGIAPYTYSWSPTGGTSNLATGLTTGTYSILVTDSVGNCMDTTVTLGVCTSINEIGNNKSIRIYPNPNNGYFQIQTNTNTVSIEIYNSIGEAILSKNLNYGTNSIDLKNYSDGLYYIKVLRDTKPEYYKLIKN